MGYRDGNLDVPDPGSGSASPMKLKCVQCEWRVSDNSALKAVQAAQAHVKETGHDISYRGVVQQGWPRAV